MGKRSTLQALSIIGVLTGSFLGFLSCSPRTKISRSHSYQSERKTDEVRKRTVPKDDSPSPSSPNPRRCQDSAPFDTSCDARGACRPDSTLRQDYYKHKIVAHGGPGKRWSSAEDTKYRNLRGEFISNTHFSVRVVALPAPPKGTIDSLEVKCNYGPLPYTKLKVTVGIKASGSRHYYEQHTFDDISVDGCSNVYEFSGLPPTDGDLVLDIVDVKWDRTCNEYRQERYLHPSEYKQYCPWSKIYDKRCWSVQIQWATDSTYDIPH